MANTVVWHLNSPCDINMKIPDDIKRSIVYLGVKRDGKITYRATGFLVSVPCERFHNMTFSYMATAKHNADKLMQEDIFYIGANSKEGRIVNIAVKKENVEWLFHPTDDSADVAVISMNVPLAGFDIANVPLAVFLKESDIAEVGAGAGDEVCIVGLFSFHPGTSKNHPIVRTGNVAMMPDEPIFTEYSKNTKAHNGLMQAYLIEARSIAGLSGSPVFLIKSKFIPDGDKVILGQLYLLGLIHGHWDVSPDSAIDGFQEDSDRRPNRVNVGIAIVAPAQKIIDIINRKDAAEERRKVSWSELSKNPPTAD